ncbi:MAG: alpha/beta hydrolase [Bacteroidales bacterium]|nr:alpha/beta hydrolase [Bacteroidales bacterium]
MDKIWKPWRLAAAFAAVFVVFTAVSSCSTKKAEEEWARYLDPPAGYSFEPDVRLVKTWSFDGIDVELLLQANGPGTSQRVVKVFPKRMGGTVPAVVVPYYFPEGMLGFELETGELLPRYEGIEMMVHLARRGFACISADAYHLTYVDSPLDRGDFGRWQLAGEALKRDWPSWTGMGKLVADTRLLVDLLEEDPRVDASRIGVAGHSLGGKMAFFTGCVDPRIKAILASDFGLRWEQSNWEKIWYFGEDLEEMKAKGMDLTGLLSLSGGKPFFLIAGKDDDETSWESMKKASGYRRCPDHLGFLNHASGHRPPGYALDAGYDFLEKYLKPGEPTR